MPLPTDKNAIRDLISEIQSCEQAIKHEIPNNYWQRCSNLNAKNKGILLLAWMASIIGIASFIRYIKDSRYTTDTEGAAPASFILMAIAGPAYLLYLASSHLERYPVSRLIDSKQQTQNLIETLQAMGELTNFSVNSSVEDICAEIHAVNNELEARLQQLARLEYAKQHEGSSYLRRQVLFHHNALQKLSQSNSDENVFSKEDIIIEEEDAIKPSHTNQPTF